MKINVRLPRDFLVAVKMMKELKEYPYSFVSVEHLGNEIGESYDYVAKIAHRLKKSGLTQAKKGPRGGIQLSDYVKKKRLITVKELMDAVELDFYPDEDTASLALRELSLSWASKKLAIEFIP